MITINSGVAIDLLGFCGLKDSANTVLNPHHFPPLDLGLNDLIAKIQNETIASELEHPMYNLRHFLKASSNEASLCALFWNLTITTLFKVSQNADPLNYRLELEWNCKQLYANAENFDVDLVCLADFNYSGGRFVSIPMLSVESSRYKFARNEQHTDFSKMAGMMSAHCITLAHRLIEIGRTPELARVFGMLIGGSSVQFFVAQAAITQVLGTVDLFEVHAEIHFKDEWCFDIFGTSQAQGSAALQQEANDTFNFNNIQFVGTLDQINVEHVEESDFEGTEPRYAGDFNFNSLKNIKAFIEKVKSQIKLIRSEAAIDNTCRRYNQPSLDFCFSESLGKRLEPTNGERQASSTRLRYNLNQTTHFSKLKSSLFELAVYKKCSAYFPSFFPRIYEIEESAGFDGNKIKYTFELMKPLVTRETGVSNILLGKDPVSNIIEIVKCMIDCLYELHLLHSVIGILHCDISPLNIMYSEVDRIWKILDFDSSIEKSRAKADPSRRVGTPGFIAPECLELGAYSELSDVFALGTVAFDVLYHPLYRQIDEDADYAKYFYTFEADVLGMNDPDPATRKSLEISMLRLFNLLKEMLPNDSPMLKDQVLCAVQTLIENDFEISSNK